MSTREKIIQALEEAKGEYVSGESLADELGLSRNAIWKAINELKKAGYPIESVRNRGHMLAGSSDIISKAGISLYLNRISHSNKNDSILGHLFVYDELDSTNTQAKREIFLEGADVCHRTVIVAKTQRAGRGHRGTGFDSPDGGIYLSIILDPAKTKAPQNVSLSVAAMVTEVIEKLYAVSLNRKKDNSLYKGNKKICGILTEAVSDLETGIYSAYIVGIGIRTDRLAAPAKNSPSKNHVIASLLAGSSKL